MKITVVSKDAGFLHHAKIFFLNGGNNKYNDLIELVNSQPSDTDYDSKAIVGTGLLIIDGRDNERQNWQQLEVFNTRHPLSTSIIVGSKNEATILGAMRIGMRDVIEYSEFDERVSEIASRARDRLQSQGGDGAGCRIFSFLPTKGGSGASFLSSNLAYALSRVCGKKVLMLDLDLEFSDASFCLADDDSGKNISDLMAYGRINTQSIENSSVKIGSNLYLLRAPRDPEAIAEIVPETVDDIIDSASRAFDFIIIDLARALDPLAIRAMDKSDTVFTVMQTGLPYVRGMQRLKKTFQALNYYQGNEPGKIRLVANRQGNKDDMPLEQIEKAVDTKFHIQMPNDFVNVNASINAGRPLFDVAPDGILSKALIAWAKDLSGIKDEHLQGGGSASGVFSSLMGRFEKLFSSSSDDIQTKTVSAT